MNRMTRWPLLRARGLLLCAVLIVNSPWGTLTFTFSDCNHGKVEFNSTRGFGTGSMDLARLTLPAGLTCP